MCKGNIVMTGTRTQYNDYVKEVTPTMTASTTTPPPTTIPATTRKMVNGTIPSMNVTSKIPVREIILPRWRWWTPTPEPTRKLVSRPKVEKFDIKIPVTMEMVPSCKVMVYYVRHDKEVVADTVDFDVEDKLNNQVEQPSSISSNHLEFFANHTPQHRVLHFIIAEEENKINILIRDISFILHLLLQTKLNSVN